MPTLADLRGATFALAERLLATVPMDDRPPWLESLALRDAFIETLFATLLSMPDADSEALIKVRRVYWQTVLASQPFDLSDWKQVLRGAFELARHPGLTDELLAELEKDSHAAPH